MTRSGRSARPAAFTDAQIETGFWLVLAHVLGLDAATPLPSGVDEGVGGDITGAPTDTAVPVGSDQYPYVRPAIDAARARVASDPSLTLSVVDHDRARLEVLARLGRVSSRGAAQWPVGSRTVSTRLGGGSWSEALTRLGMAAPVSVRPGGNRRFDEDDYLSALQDFQDACVHAGTTPSFVAYGTWCAEQRSEGHRRPAGATLRQHFGSWSQALARVAAG